MHHRADSSDWPHCSFMSYLPFFPTIIPVTEKNAPSGHIRQNVIYLDLAQVVTTTRTPNLLFGGQVISNEPTKHRAEE